MSVTHKRVANVGKKGATWDLYVGRNQCPCGLAGCSHVRGSWGNPFSLQEHGPVGCMTKFFDLLASCKPDVSMLRGKVLGCWCKGRYPVCHAEALARLADGEPLDAIRADMLARLAPKQPEPDLFSGAP